MPLGISPNSLRRHVVAHELAHVLQQRRGHRSVASAPSAAESEADSAARAVSRGEPVSITGSAAIGCTADARCQEATPARPPPTIEELKQMSPEVCALLWHADFNKGLTGSGTDKQVGDAWDVVKRNMSSAGREGIESWLGFGTGIPIGIFTDLAGQVKALASLGSQLAKLYISWKPTSSASLERSGQSCTRCPKRFRRCRCRFSTVPNRWAARLASTSESRGRSLPWHPRANRVRPSTKPSER
jgi:hypothetical protein